MEIRKEILQRKMNLQIHLEDIQWLKQHNQDLIMKIKYMEIIKVDYLVEDIHIQNLNVWQNRMYMMILLIIINFLLMT